MILTERYIAQVAGVLYVMNVSFSITHYPAGATIKI